MNASLLLVDDDDTFRDVLARAFIRRGYAVQTAADADEAAALASDHEFGLAVVDLRMPGESGLTLIERLMRITPEIRIVVLTGYASIATAVEAIKLGAIHYLTKPAHVDDIIAAFSREDGDAATPVASAPPSVDRLEWEHIQKILGDCGGNISEAARRLGMHRRTWQRKLQKRPVRR
jgi:two-component system response regulator RegA